MNKILKFLFLALILVACAPATPVEPAPDVNAIRTSAAMTVVSEFTLTAAAITPTSAPPTGTPTLSIPTETATAILATDPTQIALGTPGALCDDYSFSLTSLDVTIPDGTPMTP